MALQKKTDKVYLGTNWPDLAEVVLVPDVTALAKAMDKNRAAIDPSHFEYSRIAE